MRNSSVASGWRGVALIAVVYVYFLIFAQFAFLTRLAELGIGGNALKVVMTAMAAGGILLSLLSPRSRAVESPALRLRLGLALAATAAMLTLLPLEIKTAALVAFLIGAGLGVTTVTLVTHLNAWATRGVLDVGFGTGIAYFICNVPGVFTANPHTQAILAAALCVAAIGVPLPSPNNVLQRRDERMPISFPIALVSFAALIWLDSAAFYIIQHTATLRKDTWMGSAHLWSNGALHFFAAVMAAMLIRRGRVATTITLAFASLAFACLLLRDPALTLSASVFYPIGVSLYSVALVAYPSFLTNASSTADRARQAGWIYAIAGWIGSALGVGMGQNLGHIPLAFIASAGVVVLAPLCIAVIKRHPREFALIAVVATLAAVAQRLLPNAPTAAALTPAERGRQVYISEGCISCHSQYVRPNSRDSLMWGPQETSRDLHAQKPPLIGNRRQGPDLSQVGFRRSPLWLKAHLICPGEISYRSPMPSYAFLFGDIRGDELVSYLSGLRGTGEQQQLQREAAWLPESSASQSANMHNGQIVYEEHCATCHDAQGATRLHWLAVWRKVPPTLAQMRIAAANQPKSRLAQIAKFGVAGTDMPGHEYLSDQQIASVALWLKLAPMRDASQPLTNTGEHE
jgi:cbb3-type cytochrome c oxidase subunit II